MINIQKFLREHTILIVIILFAVFLRIFYYMGILRGDDAGYYFIAHKLADGQFNPTLWGGEGRIGLYYPAALFIRLFGTSEFVATLFPLLASLLAIVFIYGIVCILRNKTSGLLAAFLWAVFPLDIFLATQLMPDGPTAMATSGTVFFFLYASRLPLGLARISRYFLSALFAVWAFLIKASTITIGLVIFGLFLYQNISLLERLIQKFRKYSNHEKLLLVSIPLILFLILIGKLVAIQPPVFVNNFELTSSDISFTWLLGRINPVQVSDLGAYWITDRPIFTPKSAPEILTQPSLGERIRIFDLTIPLFLVAAVYGLTYQKRELYVPLIWFFLSFFYLEWGSYPRGLALPALFVYTPITHWIDARNLILACVPVVIVISLFLSHIFSEVNLKRVVLISSLLTIWVAVGLKTTILGSLVLNFIYLAILISLITAAYSPFLLSKGKNSGPRYQFLASLIVVALSIGSLLPVPHFHVSDYYKEQARRENLKLVLKFLETQPKLPIYGVGGPAFWLDVYSGFRLGYDYFDQGSQYPEMRMTDDPTILDKNGGFKVEYGCGLPVDSFENWPLIEFGQSLGEKTCVSLIRVFPAGDLEGLIASRKLASISPKIDNINLYLAAAAHSENIGEMVSALAEFVTYYPDQIPIIEASHLLSAYGPKQLRAKTIDLMNSFEQCKTACPWTFSNLLTPGISIIDAHQVLSVRIDKKTDEIQNINIDLALKSGTAYVLSLELRSSALYDLVRLNDLQIPDSYANSWNKTLDWTTFQIVFVTPNWAEAERNVFMELARVFDKGTIEFRQIDLIELGHKN